MREALRAGRLELALWPSRIYALPVALFTALWLRFLWRWYGLCSVPSAEGARGFVLVFGLPFVLAGISLIGTSLRLVVGRTAVQLDAHRLQVAEEAVFGRRRTLSRLADPCNCSVRGRKLRRASTKIASSTHGM